MTLERRVADLERRLNPLFTHPILVKLGQGGPLAIPKGGFLLEGRLVIGGNPTNRQALMWNATLSRYEPQDLPTGGDSTHAAITLAADAAVLLGLSAQEINFNAQVANLVFAGPSSGADADPTFRALVDADIPPGVMRDAEHVAVGDASPHHPQAHGAAQHTAESDATAIHDNVASELSAITEKVTPVAADLLVIEDSAAANAKKRVQVGNLPGDNHALDNPIIHADVQAMIEENGMILVHNGTKWQGVAPDVENRILASDNPSTSPRLGYTTQRAMISHEGSASVGAYLMDGIFPAQGLVQQRPGEALSPLQRGCVGLGLAPYGQPTNLVENPGPNTNTNGWVPVSPGTVALGGAGTGLYGNDSIVWTLGSAIKLDLRRVDNATRFSVTAGKKYTFSCWTRGTVESGQEVMELCVQYFDSAGAAVGKTCYRYLEGTKYGFRAHVTTAPTGAVTAQPSVELTVGVQTPTEHITCGDFVEGDLSHGHIDGGQVGCIWAGTANASQSTRDWMPLANVRLGDINGPLLQKGTDAGELRVVSKLRINGATGPLLTNPASDELQLAGKLRIGIAPTPLLQQSSAGVDDLKLTGRLEVTKTLALNGGTLSNNIGVALGIPATFTASLDHIDSPFASGNANANNQGIRGYRFRSFIDPANFTGAFVRGFEFDLNALLGANATSAYADLTGVSVKFAFGAEFRTATVVRLLNWAMGSMNGQVLGGTLLVGWDIQAFTPTNIFSDFYVIRMPDRNISAITGSAYGLQLGDLSGGSPARILELGPTAGPYLRLLGSGEWTAATDETPLYLAEGATPTLRQIKVEATREVFLEPRALPAASTFDDWAFASLSDTGETKFVWRVPADFQSLTSVNIVLIPDTTETIQADLDVSVAAVGETYNNDTRQSLNQTKAVTINQITEWNIRDIGTLFQNIAVGDYVAIRFQSDTATLRCVGCRIQYEALRYAYLA